jgi:hypothetical protein
MIMLLEQSTSLDLNLIPRFRGKLHLLSFKLGCSCLYIKMLLTLHDGGVGDGDRVARILSKQADNCKQSVAQRNGCIKHDIAAFLTSDAFLRMSLVQMR